MTAAEHKKGEENLYREEKYAAVYEINMLRCIFCGLCEEACPRKEADALTDRIIPSNYGRNGFVFGKDKLVEPMDNRVDVTKRQTPAVIEFKKDKFHQHNITINDLVDLDGRLTKKCQFQKYSLGLVSSCGAVRLDGGGREKPRTQCAVPNTDLFRHSGALFPAERPFPRSRPHHRVCRGHHGLVPLHHYDGQFAGSPSGQKAQLVQVRSTIAGLMMLAHGSWQAGRPDYRHQPSHAIGTVESLGTVLFNEFLLPFEISALLFLSAMVGAVLLSKKSLQS